MCESCFEQINKAFSFKKLCQEKDFILRNILSKNQPFKEPTTKHETDISLINNDCKFEVIHEAFSSEESDINDDFSRESENYNVYSNFANRNSQRNVKLEQTANNTLATNSSSKQCRECGENLIEIDEKTHIKTCHTNDKHTCCVCRKNYVNLQLLKRHLRVHKYNLLFTLLEKY